MASVGGPPRTPGWNGRISCRALHLLGKTMHGPERKERQIVDLLIDPETSRVRSFLVLEPLHRSPVEIPAERVTVRGSGEVHCRPTLATTRNTTLATRGPVPSRKPRTRGIAVRRLSSLAGALVHAPDGAAGSMSDVLLEEGGWRVLHFVVRVTDGDPSDRVLVLPNWVNEIAPENKGVHVGIPREQVEACPRYESARTVDAEFTLQMQEMLPCI